MSGVESFMGLQIVYEGSQAMLSGNTPTYVRGSLVEEYGANGTSEIRYSVPAGTTTVTTVTEATMEERRNLEGQLANPVPGSGEMPS